MTPKEKWNKVFKICDNPDKWIEVYKHYQDLLTIESAKDWYNYELKINFESNKKISIEFTEYLLKDYYQTTSGWCKLDDNEGKIHSSEELFNCFIKEKYGK